MLSGAERELLPALRGILAELKKVAPTRPPRCWRAPTASRRRHDFRERVRGFRRAPEKQLSILGSLRISVKFSGAAGNYNAHHAAFPPRLARLSRRMTAHAGQGP